MFLSRLYSIRRRTERARVSVVVSDRRESGENERVRRLVERQRENPTRASPSVGVGVGVDGGLDRSEARCGPRARLKGTERATRAQYARDIARPVGIWGPQLRPRFAQSRQISRRAHNPPSVNILCHRVRNAKSSECGLWDVCRRSTGTLTTATPDTSPYYVSPYGRSERGGWTHLLDRSGTLGQFLLANFLGASF